jgi:hypothetical protein
MISPPVNTQVDTTCAVLFDYLIPARNPQAGLWVALVGITTSILDFFGRQVERKLLGAEELPQHRVVGRAKGRVTRDVSREVGGGVLDWIALLIRSPRAAQGQPSSDGIGIGVGIFVGSTNTLVRSPNVISGRWVEFRIPASDPGVGHGEVDQREHSRVTVEDGTNCRHVRFLAQDLEGVLVVGAYRASQLVVVGEEQSDVRLIIGAPPFEGGGGFALPLSRTLSNAKA